MIQSVFNEYFELFEIKSELVKNMYFKCKMMKLFMLYLNVLLGIPNHRVGDKAEYIIINRTISIIIIMSSA